MRLTMYDNAFLVAWRLNSGHKALNLKFFSNLDQARKFYKDKVIRKHYDTVVLFTWNRSPYIGDELYYMRQPQSGQENIAFQYPNHEDLKEICRLWHYNHLYILPGKIDVLELFQKPDHDGVYPLWRP